MTHSDSDHFQPVFIERARDLGLRRIGGPTLPAALAGFMDSALTATLA